MKRNLHLEFFKTAINAHQKCADDKENSFQDVVLTAIHKVCQKFSLAS